MNGRRPIIAIDGPAGVGKSTLARRLAEEFDLPYLNTGLMYRAVAHAAIGRRIDPEDGDALASLARGLTFDLDRRVRPPELSIDGAPAGPGLTSPEVESIVSRVARHPEVRAALRAQQQRLAADGGVVEGRDIATVVLPDADVKIFLRAAERERIARRRDERPGHDVGRALAARDALDAATNPFEPAEEAVTIDTSRMGADDVFETARSLVRERLEERER